ncbi:MAG: FkbM family methyltransferase [Sulfuritalea sp.]|nr:FkbM family methyltransferase [Sulfuritalea sp.]
MTNQSALQLIERGDSFRDSGALDDAILAYQHASEVDPALAMGPYKLGTVYMRLGRADDAKECFRKALELDPEYPEALNNLGIHLAGNRELDVAESLYRKALAKRIDYFEAHINLGNLLVESGRRIEALYFYERAMQLRPDSALAKQRMGPLLRDLGRIAEAVEILNQAIYLDPHSAEAWNDIGACHISRGDISTAENALKEALRLDRNLIPAWINLMLISNWRSRDRAGVYALHCSFGQHMMELTVDSRFSSFPNVVDKERRLRVGFVSGDFRRHSVSYFIRGPLSYLNRTKVEAWAYFNHSREDERTQELKPLFEEWRNIHGLADKEAAEIVRRDGIDILFDLTGHTGHSRLGLFALKPAPVQISWIGYPNTTGLPTIDYRLTDNFADPVGSSEEFHTENLIRFPNCFLCYSPIQEAPEISVLPAIERGCVTFGSFNTRVKIGDETLGLWRQVLEAIPSAKLVLKSAVGLSEQSGRDELLREIARAGIDTGRITIHSAPEALDQHLALYGTVDIGLDTFPYHGTTTTCEALWMGVPVVTLAGESHVSRVGVSLLSNLGLNELIAHNTAEYVRIAVELSEDLTRLAELRSTMRPRMAASPLMDAPSMARDLELILRRAWVDYCSHAQFDPSRAVSGSHCVVETQGNFRIAVADDFRKSITSWVALEQEDWFEDEIGFVRKIVKPDWHAIDVGANHGVYSLSLAGSGARRVWALEPASEPRLYLRNSVALNGFTSQIEILPYGLSSESKMAEILLFGASEENTIHPVRDDKRPHKTEAISLVALDDLIGNEIPPNTPIEFFKLDAEGEEVAILRGGLRFFHEQSPLVMFEYKHGLSVNIELAITFRTMGYDLFRLVPGLGCLVPVLPGMEANLDKYTLNLFACKIDTADRLAADSLLVKSEPRPNMTLCREWSQVLYAMPALASTFAGNRHFNFESDYGNALLAWCGSRQDGLSAGQRFQLLTQAFGHFQLANAGDDCHPAVAVLGTRICADIGMRSHAVDFAQAFLDQMASADEMPIDRPVPPAYSAFDTREPKSSFGELIFESIVELDLDRYGYSRYYLATRALLLEKGLNNPEHTPRLERTALLCHLRDKTPIPIRSISKLFQYSSDNLNPGLWRRITGES